MNKVLNGVKNLAKRGRQVPIYMAGGMILGGFSGSLLGAHLGHGDFDAIKTTAEYGMATGTAIGLMAGNFIELNRDEIYPEQGQRSASYGKDFSTAKSLDYLARDFDKNDNYYRSMKLSFAAGEEYWKEKKPVKSALMYIDGITITPFYLAKRALSSKA